MVARTLREMTSGIDYSAKNQAYALASSSNGSYGGYGTYSANSRAFDQLLIKKQSDALLSVDFDKRWQALEISASDMRRKLAEKYKVDF